MPAETALTDRFSESALPLTDELSLDPNLIRQIVLKLAPTEASDQGSQSGLSSSAQTDVVPIASAQVLEEMQRLVKTITDLRSPQSGWSPDRPKTSETIAPYVVEEAYDVLEALQKNYFDPPQAGSVGVNEGGDRWQSYFLVADLAPWLLWCVARSSHEMMRLLEGIPGKVFRLGQGWRTGIVRLVITLETTLPGLSTSLDLTTYQEARSLLPTDTMLQSDQYSSCQQPTWIAGLLPSLIQQVQATTPSVSLFFAGAEVDALAPKRNWQSGTIQLQLGFEFTATDTTVFPDFSQVSTTSEEMAVGAIASPSPISADAANIEAPQPTPPSSHPTVKFTDPNWLEKYSATLLQRQLASTVQQLPTFRAAGEKNRNLSSQSLIPLIVKDACEIADLLQNSPMLSNQAFLQQEVSMATLTHQLLWSFSRSAFEVMQLMGGIRANLLQPECEWETGILRLLASIKSKTLEHDWHLDVTTGQPPQPQVFPLAHNVIVQSNESRWCYQPNVLEQLENKLMQQLEQVAPELLLFMSGTDVDVLSHPPNHQSNSQLDSQLNNQLDNGLDEQQWHSGTIQLSAKFEFIPDLSTEIYY
jgi:hypothetical protein